MIITDGTTTFTKNTAEGNGDYVPIKSKKITAGGQIRTRTTGNRYYVSEMFEVTGSELSDIIGLINNNSISYDYTPTVIPPEWTSGDFPMPVSIDYVGKTERVYNGSIQYFITLEIESIEVYNT